MKILSYGFVLAAVLALCSAAAYGEAPVGRPLESGKTGASGIVPEAGNNLACWSTAAASGIANGFNLERELRLSDVCAGAGFSVAAH